MTGPVIPAPSTRVVEQHSGVVLSGEGLRVANDRLDTMARVAVSVDELVAENSSLRHQLRVAQAHVEWHRGRDAEASEELELLIEENSSLRMRLEELGPHL